MAAPLSKEILAKGLDKSSWSEAAFVAEALGLSDVAECTVETWTHGGGAACDSNTLTVKKHDGSSTQYFLKLTNASSLDRSKQLGTAREGLFYNVASHVPLLQAVTPRIFFSHGDMDMGAKTVVMELINGVQAGYFFGNVTFHNWGRDLNELTKGFTGITEPLIVVECFKLAAKLHAVAWDNDAAMTTSPEWSFLRAQDWAVGQGRESWDASCELAKNAWFAFRDKMTSEADQAEDSKPAERIKMDPRFIAVLDAAFAKTNWESFLEEWKTMPHTIVHGDFHPSNVVVRRPVEGSHGHCDVVLVDWEATGIGSGPQDLGQFLISHSAAEQRRAEEKTALEAYSKTLAENGVHVGMDYIKREYVRGGIGRWFWLFGICTMWLPLPVMQFFHDQMFAFILDHNVTADDVPLVRM